MNPDRLVCFDLDQPRIKGFRKFISSWLVRNNGCTLLVDPGPLSTIPQLIAGLERHAVTSINYILLTHIHIDHAGGTGALLERFPGAKVICHPDGIRHLIAPEKLWLGSQQVLGELAAVYGEILPVPEKAISFAETVEDTGVCAFLTPGHAQHHVSYLLDDILFAGEVAGVRSDCSGGIYMRPATPPRFILPVALESIDKMIALAPKSMVFAHYGLVPNALDHLHIARRQLLLWVQGLAITALEISAHRDEATIAWLMEHDLNFRNIDLLPEDIKAREHYFLGNSLRGMSEYVDALSATERQAWAEQP